MSQPIADLPAKPAPPALLSGAHAGVLMAAGVLWLSGCVSPYAGCVMPGGGREYRAPPAAWAQRSVPINPSPVQYDRRVGQAPPVLELQPTPVMDLQAPSQDGPAVPHWVPTHSEAQPSMVPPAPEASSLLPPAPGVETPPVPIADPVASVSAETQARIDQMAAQIANLDRRLQEQSQALTAAQYNAATAQATTQRLEKEFNAWRTELSLVRETIRAQSSADLQVLDELNSALEQLLPDPSAPEPQPSTDGEAHMARERRLRGVRQ